MEFLRRLYGHYGKKRLGDPTPEWEEDLTAYHNDSKKFILVLDGNIDDRVLFMENVETPLQRRSIQTSDAVKEFPWFTMSFTERTSATKPKYGEEPKVLYDTAIKAHRSKQAALQLAAETFKVSIEKIDMVEWKDT